MLAAPELEQQLEAVLPRVAYRQWTLTLPRTVGWVVCQQPGVVRLNQRPDKTLGFMSPAEALRAVAMTG